MTDAKHVRKQTCHISGREIDFHETVYMVNGKVTCREEYDKLYPRCPYCRALQDKPVEHMGKCQRCEQTIHVDDTQFLFPTVLLTREQADAVQQFRELLAPLGIKESRYGLYAQQLTAQNGQTPEPDEVIQALWKQAQLSVGPDSTGSDRPDNPMVAAPGALHSAGQVSGEELLKEMAEREKARSEALGDTEVELEAEEVEIQPGDPEYDPSKDKQLMQEFTRRALILLKEYGIHRRQAEYAHKRFSAKFKRDPQPSELIEALTKLCLIGLEDKQVGLIMLARMARLFYSSGLNPRHVQKERAKTQLKILKHYNTARVQVETGDMPCQTCFKIEGKQLDIDDALIRMPIPPKDCDNRPDPSNKYPFCLCDYSPVDDLEIDSFEDMLSDAGFTAFLDSLDNQSRA